MSRINEKMGLRPAGKRAIMKLPKNRAEAARLTALKCPCGHRDVVQNVIHGELRRMCAWCSNTEGFTT